MRRTTFPTLAAVTAAITAAVTGCGGGPSCPEDALPGLCVAPARTVAIGRGIADVAALDLDGDGVDEWIAISEDAPALRIYRGGALRTAPLAGEPSALAVGDLDGDGHLGVAVALRSGDAVAIFTREGDGDLVQAALHPVGRSPRDLWLGDLDGDGRPELVTADAGDASLSILDGADRARRSVAAGEAPVQVAAGDLDGDGRLDLLVHDYADGAILGLRGREGGRLRPAERLLGAAGLASFAAGDLDGDGLVDLALQRDVDRRVAVHFADGAGGLGPAMELDPGFSDVPGVALVPAADGDPGAVVTASGDALYTWPIDPVRTVRPPELAADGASTIAAALLPLGGGALLLGDDHRAVIQGLTPELRLTPTWDRPSPDAPHVYVSGEPGFGDLDGDGEVDLVVNTWRDGVLTFHGDGRGGFTPGAMVPAPPGYFIAVADVSGDGRPDLVIAAADVLWIAVQADDGGFVPAEKIDLRADSEDMVALRGADRARIAVDVGPEGIDVFTLDGAGGLVAVITPRPGLSSSRLRAGDLDGDGDDDLVILGALDGVRGLTSLLSEGTGFLDGPLHREDDLLGDDLAAAEDVALGDLDGDGDLDAAIAAPDRVVRVLDPGADAPTIAVDPITYAPPIRWGPLSLGDVDGDRHLDLLRPQEGTLVLHRGRPGAGFDPEPELRIFSAEPRILPADLRRDARVDFVTKDERELRAFVGEVAPVAHERAALDLAPRFEALRLGDLDGDGAPELVARAARGV
ncbi:MAG: VCBS repeat-containing protein, partial [Nannocystaceae bacterium]